MIEASTLTLLEKALERIREGKPKNIDKNRKLSVRAIEQEAGAGNGSAYYYKDFVERVKRVIAEKKVDDKAEIISPLVKQRERLQNEIRLKQKYREQKRDTDEKLAYMVARLHEAHSALYEAQREIEELQYEVVRLKNNNVVSIRPVPVFEKD